ncbi:MAG: hypothetical protein JWR07_3850 [Nevskia sp.]|nr:hypothetical protein [Nevskia sp.]
MAITYMERGMRRFFALIVLLLVSPVGKADEQALQESIQEQSKSLMLLGDVAGIDRIANGYRQTGELTPAGFSKLSLFYNGLERVADDPHDPAWALARNKTDAWLKAHADSPAAVIIDAKLLVKYAWALRGHGFGYTVTPGQAGQFDTLVESARQVLDANKKIGSVDPEWYALRISVANWQGVNRNEILKLSTWAAQQAPYYDPIHYAAVYAMLPKWGGSTDLVKQYVATATALTAPKQGTQIYGRIYLYVARRAGSEIAQEFSAAGERWPDLSASMVEIIAAHPDAWNVNSYRILACSVGTKDDYKRAMKDLKDHYGAKLIPIYAFDTPQWQQRCVQWAAS